MEMEMEMDPQANVLAAASTRRPIQCEGISRGPDRMTEVAVAGSVNPQIVAPPLDWTRPPPFWQSMIVY
jgi:hypothetical protein